MEGLTNPLHHAYVIEGGEYEFLSLQTFLKEAGIITADNPALIEHYTQFNIENARNLKQSAYEAYEKRAIIIVTDTVLVESAQALLKLFEEPVKGLHIFLIVPDVGAIIPTLLSRVFVIRKNKNTESGETKAYLKMTVEKRMEWIKSKLDSFEDSKEARAFTKQFLSELMQVARKEKFDTEIIETLMKYSLYSNDRGSSSKMLLEYISLALPTI